MIRLRVQQIKMNIHHCNDDLEKKLCSLLKVSLKDIHEYKITKKSIDARKKNNIFFVYTIDVSLKSWQNRKIGDNNIIMLTNKMSYKFPYKNNSSLDRPIIIGAGPAGLFAALLLAENGFSPIVLERGANVDERLEHIRHFFENGSLNEESNVQFGEGGAGTFSDGKLNTQVKDSFFRREKILDEFVLAGAPEEIAYLNKPHIGTDYLVRVVKNLRKKIEALGGEVLFHHKVTSLLIEDGKAMGVCVNNERIIQSNHVVLAIGHSARDTFKMLKKIELLMEPKAFAIGLRIEHSQEMISKNQYGTGCDLSVLPSADYKLTYRTNSGRGVYSFCMCPGGYVVNASSEKGHLVCNGMSNFKRNGTNANSAIVVNVTPDDFEGEDVLKGMEFQKRWERLAFQLGGGDFSLPMQLWSDFLNNKKSTEFGSILPSTKSKYCLTNLNDCLPNYVAEAIKEGVLAFDKKIPGFAAQDALLTGIETRTSSPIRMNRNDEFESNFHGLYPCGEGAGYAGGIMSAAMDGIKVAEQIARNYRDSSSSPA